MEGRGLFRNVFHVARIGVPTGVLDGGLEIVFFAVPSNPHHGH